MARINNQLIKGKSMQITSLLIMMIASLGICQADAATRCALDEFRDYQGISLDEIVVMPKR